MAVPFELAINSNKLTVRQTSRQWENAKKQAQLQDGSILEIDILMKTIQWYIKLSPPASLPLPTRQGLPVSRVSTHVLKGSVRKTQL